MDFDLYKKRVSFMLKKEQENVKIAKTKEPREVIYRHIYEQETK